MPIAEDIGIIIKKFIHPQNLNNILHNMTLQPVKDINEYKRVKESLRERFEAERTGDQDLFREQSKIFQPLITTQQQTVKTIKDGQDVSAAAVNNALMPFTMELQRRNDALAEIPAISSIPASFMNVDLDTGLNETDRKNLQDMSLELPSLVFKNKIIEDTLEKIKTENKSIGQKLGIGQKVLVKRSTLT